MKKRFSIIVGFACAVVAGLLVSACKVDGYETGEGEYSSMVAEFADTYTATAKTLKSMVTDEGDSMAFLSSYTCDWAQTPDSVYRSLVYYRNDGGGKADVLSVRQVMVPTIVPHYKVEDIKTDPIHLESSWKGRNGRYLTFRIKLLTGTAEGQDNRQTIGMICDTLMANEGAHKHLHLRLFHNQNGVPQFYSYQSYVSVPLKQNPYHLQPGDTVSLSVNTYDGEVVKSFVY